MGILDDAIKEHLELKRRHGAGESELQQLEDEAFGAAERPGGEASAPDPLAEAPTQFMEQPEVDSPAQEAEATKPEPEAAEAEADESSSRPAPRAEIADLQEAPAAEHEIPSGPSTEEREAIAEQPTEMYDVEEELTASEPEAPSEEQLIEEEMDEPRLAPVDPLSGLDEGIVEVKAPEAEPAAEEEEEEYEEDDDFWDEKRLSDELDQALEAPVELEEDAATGHDEDDELTASPVDEDDEDEEAPASRDEDVLEETPDFLEETPEDDQLWFEQKPPKDFDFDD
jgi:hypothetical protein